MKRFFGWAFAGLAIYFGFRWFSIPVLEPEGLMQCVWLGLAGVCALAAVCLLEPQPKQGFRYRHH